MAIIGFGIYGRSETDRIGKGTVFHESLRISCNELACSVNIIIAITLLSTGITFKMPINRRNVQSEDTG